MFTLELIISTVAVAPLAVLALRWAIRRSEPEEIFELPEFAFVTYSGLQLEPEHRDCVWLPASFLRRLIADPEAHRIARFERDRVAEAAASIEEIGVQVPLIIVIDNDGVCLRDGHHRVVSGVREYYPVKLEHSERIRKHKLPISELIEVLWKMSL